jgi:hypothetical protein
MHAATGALLCRNRCASAPKSYGYSKPNAFITIIAELKSVFTLSLHHPGQSVVR